MLAAPTAPDERLPRVAARARGFVYAVGLLGVTGERASLAASATELAARLKRITDRPVLVGVGVSNAAQAREACAVADGVVQGASVVRRLMEGGPDAVGAYVAEVRAAIDAGADDATCELCEAARLTEWFYEDDECWIAECEACMVPMVVWRVHDPDPPERRQGRCSTPGWPPSSAEHFESEHYVDDNLRIDPDALPRPRPAPRRDAGGPRAPAADDTVSRPAESR